jgi:hypothetical protein
MVFFEVEQDIKAAPEGVWAILTDAPRLVGGDLGVTRIDGDIQPGGQIKLWSEASPGRAFALRVRVFDPPRRMTWEGGMPFGLFKGVRTFALSPTKNGICFHMREEFRGAMARMIAKTIPDLTPSLHKFALGLKALAEPQS